MERDFVITIKIADVAPLSLRIKRSEEEKVRAVEYSINKLWAQMREKNRKRSSEEVLAMVTFMFAQKYTLLAEQEPKLNETLTEFERSLDEILLKID